MPRKTLYEWDVETVDGHGDVLDHNHSDDLLGLSELYSDGCRLVLVRDVMDQADGLVDRAWAYLENGFLPECFDNGSRVPQRFHGELSRFRKENPSVNRFCRILERLRETYPELRVGQIIDNALSFAQAPTIFYVSDEGLISALQTYLTEGRS